MDFTKHDTLIAELLPKLEAFQDEYIKTHNVYWQGLETHDAAPSKDEAATKLSVRPSTKQDIPTWDDLKVISADYPFSIAVHEWVGSGRGWTVIFKASDGVDEYVKTVSYVPVFEKTGEKTITDLDKKEVVVDDGYMKSVGTVTEWVKLEKDGINR